MTTEGSEVGEAREARAPRDERPVEQRAEEIVERVSAQVTTFARWFVARAREEVEDIVAEAQELRRGSRPPD